MLYFKTQITKISISLLISFTISCTSSSTLYSQAKNDSITKDTIVLYDISRQREIPIAIYKPITEKSKKHQKIVLVSHGYNNNQKGSYLGYSYLTEFLASKGFFVVSIQHELPNDSLIPSTGIPQIVRRPFWERGADNILFVINVLKKSNPNLNFGNISLIGHSNGGDMTALFPQKHRGLVHKIITLDNRRKKLPRTTIPRVYSLRSSDQLADEGVLPTELEIEKLKMKIIKLSNTPHNNMSNLGDENQKEEIKKYVLEFLNE